MQSTLKVAYHQVGLRVSGDVARMQHVKQKFRAVRGAAARLYVAGVSFTDMTRARGEPRTFGTACAMRSSSMRSRIFSCLKSAASGLRATLSSAAPSSSSEARASQHLLA